MSSFADFADAMARPDRPATTPASVFERVAVLGGGPDARLLAALCLAEGAEVTLFSAYGRELDALRGGGIAIRGAGPLGSYQIDAEAAPSVKSTAELDRAVAGADLIFLTGPVHKQRTYAMVLADHLSDGQVLVLAPARTLGALETAWLLRIGGCTAEVTVVEAQGSPFWYSAEGNVLHLTPAPQVAAATLPSGRRNVIEGLGCFLPNLSPAVTAVHASFADGSGLVEIPALALGGPALGDGAPEIPMGGIPLPENQSFRALIGTEHQDAIDALGEERRETARRFGVRDLPDTEAWLDAYAGAARDDGRRPVPTSDEAKALIRDAAIGSLVPLVSAARIAGVPVPTTEAMVTLASTLLKADLTTAGRSLEKAGINPANMDEARRIMDSMAGGA